MEEQKQDNLQNNATKTEQPSQRLDSEQPMVIPGIRRYQFFSNLKDRMLTVDLNLVASLGIAASVAVVVFKPLIDKKVQSVYCFECRACYGTKEYCPVGIPYQAELMVSSRVKDYRRFLRNGGLLCIRCGNCSRFCTINLDIYKVTGVMQKETIQAIKDKKVPKQYLLDALKNGQVSVEFIDQVQEALLA